MGPRAYFRSACACRNNALPLPSTFFVAPRNPCATKAAREDWIIAESILNSLAQLTVLVTDTIAVAAVLAGTLVALVQCLRWIVSRSRAMDVSPRHIWIGYARWLIAALTFQLGADIVETTIAPSYEDIGRLAAIALIRTFLNYFLEKDLREARET